MPLASAPKAGSNNGAQNAAAASLRSASAGQIMSAMVRAARPRRNEHDDDRNRYIAGRAGEIAERADAVSANDLAP